MTVQGVVIRSGWYGKVGRLVYRSSGQAFEVVAAAAVASCFTASTAFGKPYHTLTHTLNSHARFGPLLYVRMSSSSDRRCASCFVLDVD